MKSALQRHSLAIERLVYWYGSRTTLSQRVFNKTGMAKAEHLQNFVNGTVVLSWQLNWDFAVDTLLVGAHQYERSMGLHDVHAMEKCGFLASKQIIQTHSG
ncbi:hypothetical protein Y032_0382g370 [Ancylostoma ceylanicum]|uniref:Uncharacterized protein n=1 Tax=Ancylostoma ceylanicum TaxID=53326 RepID=A0A016RTR2_9BILA|nr:hypothetical protein Y032_0382g370 [Ancylostoma ceylanicum]